MKAAKQLNYKGKKGGPGEGGVGGGGVGKNREQRLW